MKTPELSIIIPAAGASQRLRQPKQLIQYKGNTLIQNTVNCALSLKPCEVIVVTGANSRAVRQAVPQSPVNWVHNTDWSIGMGGSIALGASSVNMSSAGLLILLCDQWQIQAQDLSNLVTAWRLDPKRIFCARANDYRGPPVIFPAAVIGELQSLEGKNGARSILDTHEDSLTTVLIENAQWDLDTPKQLNEMTLTHTDAKGETT